MQSAHTGPATQRRLAHAHVSEFIESRGLKLSSVAKFEVSEDGIFPKGVGTSYFEVECTELPVSPSR